MAAYMQGRFVFLGIPTPERRRAARPWLQAARQLAPAAALELIEALWQRPEREYQYVACDLAVALEQQFSPEHLPALLGLVTRQAWWDSVDALATHPVGHLVLRHRHLQAEMDALVTHENFWLRRTAILYQLHWKTATDVPRLFAACLANAGEREFFIRKAIGWALRHYARTDPDAVRAFVTRHRAILSPLSCREALKHL